MCRLCEEEEKNKLKNDVYLYKKLIAKMAYKDILSVMDSYQLKGVEIGFCWDGCIRVDDELFTESDLREDEGK